MVASLYGSSSKSDTTLDCGVLLVEWDGGPLTVVSPRGLIFSKSLRSSGQDQDDIEYLRSITDED